MQAQFFVGEGTSGSCLESASLGANGQLAAADIKAVSLQLENVVRIVSLLCHFYRSPLSLTLA